MSQCDKITVAPNFPKSNSAGFFETHRLPQVSSSILSTLNVKFSHGILTVTTPHPPSMLWLRWSAIASTKKEFVRIPHFLQSPTFRTRSHIFFTRRMTATAKVTNHQFPHTIPQIPPRRPSLHSSLREWCHDATLMRWIAVRTAS